MRRLAGHTLIPFHRLAIGLAMPVNARNFDDSHRGQGGGIDELPPALGELARLFKLAQQRLEANLFGPRQPEGPGDFALAHHRR